MAPRALPMLTRFSCPAVVAADAPLPAEKESHGTGKRRWTDKIKRKIVGAVRRPTRAVRTEVEPCDAGVDKQKLKREIAEHQERRRRSEGQVLQRDSRPNGDGAAVAVINLDARPKKGILKVRSAVAVAEESSTPTLVEQLFPIGVLGKLPKSYGDGATTAVINLDARPKKGILKVRSSVAVAEESSTTPTLVEQLFPIGVLDKPPKSFSCSGPEMTGAFLVSVIAADAEKSRGVGSRTRIDRDLVDQWSEAKKNNLRRGRYLRDFCPFQEERKDDEDEQSAPEKTPPAEPDHAEEVLPVKTGLPFDSPESEAEFVNAVVSRHLLKDDFINRNAFKSCDLFTRGQSLQHGQSSASGS